MKLLLTLLILLFNTINITAQPKDFQIVLQSGVSIPLLDFSSTDLNTGSFALTGFTASGEARMIITNQIGAIVSAGIQLLPVDVGYLGYEKVKADPFLENLYIRSDPYKVIQLMAGPLYQIPVFKNINIEGQILAGVFFSSTPYQLYKPRYFMTGPPYYEITPSKDISFAYGATLRAIYDITPCYQIAVTSQFMNSKASYNFQSATRVRTEVKNISLLNTALSIILRFPASN